MIERLKEVLWGAASIFQMARVSAWKRKQILVLDTYCGYSFGFFSNVEEVLVYVATLLCFI